MPLIGVSLVENITVELPIHTLSPTPNSQNVRD